MQHSNNRAQAYESAYAVQATKRQGGKEVVLAQGFTYVECSAAPVIPTCVSLL